MTSRMNHRTSRPALRLGAIALMSLLGVACATDGERPGSPTDSHAAPVSASDIATSAGAVPGGGDCTRFLDAALCHPSEKIYSAEEVAACEANAQRSYEVCLRIEDCRAEVAPLLAACGDKPVGGTPEELAGFEDCVRDVAAAEQACIEADAP